MEQVAITYLGHACFCLESGGFRTVIDPYADGMVPGLPPLRVEAEAVYCSHAHDDHNFTRAVALRESKGSGPEVEQWQTPHDPEGGRKRGMNTVRVFHFGALRVAHLGDLGRPLTPEEGQKLQGVDCLLAPVGGYYTIDAEQARALVEQVRPRVTIPMHYRTQDGGFPELSQLEAFTGGFPAVSRGGSTLLLNEQTPQQVRVLTPHCASEISIRSGARPALEQLLHLYADAGWARYTAQPTLLDQAYDRSLAVWTAWDGDCLVGALRAVGDGCTVAYIQDLLVLRQYQRRGIGAGLLRQAMQQFASVHRLVLLTDDQPAVRAFYEHAGLRQAGRYGCTAYVRFANL